MSLQAEKEAVEALGRASDALTNAAFELMAHEDWFAAKEANAAAKDANAQCAALIDDIMARWYVRVFIWIGDRFTKSGAA